MGRTFLVFPPVRGQRMNSLADKKNTLNRVRWGVFNVFIEVEKLNS